MNLAKVQLQRNAVYRAVVCLTIVNGARDFHTGSAADSRLPERLKPQHRGPGSASAACRSSPTPPGVRPSDSPTTGLASSTICRTRCSTTTTCSTAARRQPSAALREGRATGAAAASSAPGLAINPPERCQAAPCGPLPFPYASPTCALDGARKQASSLSSHTSAPPRQQQPGDAVAGEEERASMTSPSPRASRPGPRVSNRSSDTARPFSPP